MNGAEPVQCDGCGSSTLLVLDMGGNFVRVSDLTLQAADVCVTDTEMHVPGPLHQPVMRQAAWLLCAWYVNVPPLLSSGSSSTYYASMQCMWSAALACAYAALYGAEFESPSTGDWPRPLWRPLSQVMSELDARPPGDG
jgi:hypothetical protein